MNSPSKNQDCFNIVDFGNSLLDKSKSPSVSEPPYNSEHNCEKVIMWKYGGNHVSSLLNTTAKVLTPEVGQFEKNYQIPCVPGIPRRREYGPTIAYTRDFYENCEHHNSMLDKLQKLPYEPYTLQIQDSAYTPIAKVLAYADPGIYYTFNGVTPQCKPWSEPILTIKTRVESLLNCTYNHVLLTYLPCVKARINSHKDNEDYTDTKIPIAMVSFGTTPRKMLFTRKGRRPFEQTLDSGSIMTLYDQEWYHGIISDWSKSNGMFILITFRKIDMSITPNTKLPSQQTLPESVDIHLTPAECDTFSEPATKKICMDHTIEDNSNNTIVKDITADDWLTVYNQAVVKTNTPTAVKNGDLKRFWLSKTVALTVQIFQYELYIDIREYCANIYDDSKMIPTKKGCCFNLCTFYEFSQKIEKISRSLNRDFESTMVDNCLLLMVLNEKLYIRRYDSVTPHPCEIILDTVMFKRMVEQMSEIHNFIMDYQFNTLLKSKVCLPIPLLPYMEQYLDELKDIIRNSLHDDINYSFYCRQCFIGVDSMDTHDCTQLQYSQKYKQLPYYTPMLCDIKKVAKEYLKGHRKLSYNHCDFTHLYTKTFL